MDIYIYFFGGARAKITKYFNCRTAQSMLRYNAHQELIISFYTLWKRYNEISHKPCQIWDMTVNKPNHKGTNPTTQFAHCNWRMSKPKNGNGFFKQPLSIWRRNVVHCLEVTPLLLQRKLHASPVPQFRWQPSDCPLPLCYCSFSCCVLLFIHLDNNGAHTYKQNRRYPLRTVKKNIQLLWMSSTNSQYDRWLNSAAQTSCLQRCLQFFYLNYFQDPWGKKKLNLERKKNCNSRKPISLNLGLSAQVHNQTIVEW